jgi:hypothetical protein
LVDNQKKEKLFRRNSNWTVGGAQFGVGSSLWEVDSSEKSTTIVVNPSIVVDNLRTVIDKPVTVVGDRSTVVNNPLAVVTNPSTVVKNPFTVI